jgi:hypothetical protein
MGLLAHYALKERASVQAHETKRALRTTRWAVAVSALLTWGAVMPAEPQLKSDWPRTDFGKRTVPLEEIQSGGPPKDGIPAIDRPMFVTPDEAG